MNKKRKKINLGCLILIMEYEGINVFKLLLNKFNSKVILNTNLISSISLAIFEFTTADLI